MQPIEIEKMTVLGPAQKIANGLMMIAERDRIHRFWREATCQPAQHQAMLGKSIGTRKDRSTPWPDLALSLGACPIRCSSPAHVLAAITRVLLDAALFISSGHSRPAAPHELMSSIRSAAVSIAFSSTSMPMNFLSIFKATTPVVPAPQNGSSTVWPG